MEIKQTLNKDYVKMTLLLSAVKRVAVYPNPLPPDVAECVTDTNGAYFYDYTDTNCKTKLIVNVNMVDKLKERLTAYGILFEDKVDLHYDIEVIM
jgi:hypothetical protein